MQDEEKLRSKVQLLVQTLEAIREELEGAVDIDDDEEGRPMPNRAMRIISNIDDTLAAVSR